MQVLLAPWGYLAVIVGTAVEGETVLLAAGALAHRGLLHVSLVAVCAFIGAMIGDEVWFLLGRHLGPRLLARRPVWQDRIGKVHERMGRHGDLFVVGFHFVIGLRAVTPFFLGTCGYSHARFIGLHAIGTAAWAISFAGLGWLLGEGLHHALGRFARVEEILAAAIVVAGAIWLLGRLARRHHAGPTSRATSSAIAASSSSSRRPSAPRA